MQKAEIFQRMEHKLYPPEMKNKIWNFSNARATFVEVRW